MLDQTATRAARIGTATIGADGTPGADGWDFGTLASMLPGAVAVSAEYTGATSEEMRKSLRVLPA
jgi:hypothetical protein